MYIVKTINEMKKLVEEWGNDHCSIGLVPTMGYLHAGHISLIKNSIGSNDKTVISIFVNPLQFGVGEDLDEYPRDMDSDIRESENSGVDAIFAPKVSEMYPDGFGSFANVEGVSDKMAGESRPGHFKGVCTVVNKLFNIIEPDRAYFGQKDAQQLAVIKKMVADFNMKPEIIGCPTVRERDGLAMSSRNSYLNVEERKRASNIYKFLCEGVDAYANGEKDPSIIKDIISKKISYIPGMEIDYLEIADADTMIPCRSVVTENDLCLISVKIGSTVLIDNLKFG